MKRFSYCLIILLILLSACRKNPEQDSPQNRINISQLLDIDQEIRLLSDFDFEVEYFVPQATENSFFTLMGISYIGPELVILHDKATQELIVFKRDGLFLGRLGAQGDAPLEYRSLPEVLVFSEIKEIHVIDKIGKKILRYNYNLEYIASIKLDIVPQALAVYEGKFYICAYSDNDIKATGGNDLIIRNPITFENTKALWSGINSQETKDDQYLLRTFQFFNHQDTLYFARQTKDKVFIYKIFQSSHSTELIIELNNPEERSIEESTIMQFNVVSFEDYIRIVTQRGRSMHTAYYNMKTKEVVNFKIINDWDKGLDFYPMGSCNGGGYYSDDLKINYFLDFWGTKAKDNPYKEIKSKYPEKEKWLKKTIPNALEENPWIVIVKPIEK